jgi:hypothetical protein
MPFLALTLVLVLSVTLSLPSFLVLLNGPSERISPVISTLGTTALIGSLLLLAAQLGWPYASTALVATIAFERFVCASPTAASRQARRWMVMSLSQVAAPAPGWHRISGEVTVQLVALGTRCAFSAALS